MARELTVFVANYDGKSTIMAATTSVSAFTKLVKEHPKLTNVSWDYVSETGNENDIQVAMTSPNNIFKKASGVSSKWELLPRK